MRSNPYNGLFLRVYQVLELYIECEGRDDSQTQGPMFRKVGLPLAKAKKPGNKVT